MSLTVALKKEEMKNTCVGYSKKGYIPPRVTNPVILVRYMCPVMKVCESVGRCAKPTMRLRKFATHKNTEDLVKTSEYQSLSNGF